jgi:hypothetical protein
LDIGVLAFECCFSNLTSDAVYKLRFDFFFFRVTNLLSSLCPNRIGSFSTYKANNNKCEDAFNPTPSGQVARWDHGMSPLDLRSKLGGLLRKKSRLPVAASAY